MKKFFLWAFALLLATILTAVIARQWLLERQIISWLETQGIHASLTVDALTPSSLSLRDASFARDNLVVAVESLNVSRDASGMISLRADGVKTPYATVLTLEATAAPAKDYWQIAGNIHDKTSLINAQIKGRYVHNTKRAEAYITFSQMRFTNETSLAALSPLLANLPFSFTGDVGGVVKLAYEAGALHETAMVSCKNCEITKDDVSAKGINGVVNFASLAPLATSGVQTVRISSLIAGALLERGVVTFSVAPTLKTTVASTAWKWQGGSLKTKTFSVSPKNWIPESLLLQCDRVPLSGLLQLLLAGEVKGEGTISGNVPVRIDNGRLYFDAATLIASPNGHFSYTPGTGAPISAGQNASTDILLSALANFHYTDLTLHLTSPSPQLTVIEMKLAGKNPEAYNGKPIELNARIQGDFNAILAQSMEAYRLSSGLDAGALH